MRARTKTLPVSDQSELVLKAVIALGGRNLTFREVSKHLGTDDLNEFRQGLNNLLATKKVTQFGQKRGATYSLNETAFDYQSNFNSEDVPQPKNPEEYLIDFVKDGTGYTVSELADMLSSKFPGNSLDKYSFVKQTARKGKISYINQNRGEGTRCYFYPSLPM